MGCSLINQYQPSIFGDPAVTQHSSHRCCCGAPRWALPLAAPGGVPNEIEGGEQPSRDETQGKKHGEKHGKMWNVYIYMYVCMYVCLSVCISSWGLGGFSAVDEPVNP